MAGSTVLTTDDVAPRDRAPAWCEWIHSHFGGLESDLYGDTEFDGRMAASRAGDVILTKLEANRDGQLGITQVPRDITANAVPTASRERSTAAAAICTTRSRGGHGCPPYPTRRFHGNRSG